MAPSRESPRLSPYLSRFRESSRCARRSCETPSGRRGRRFKSCHPDQLKQRISGASYLLTSPTRKTAAKSYPRRSFSFLRRRETPRWRGQRPAGFRRRELLELLRAANREQPQRHYQTKQLEVTDSYRLPTFETASQYSGDIYFRFLPAKVFSRSRLCSFESCSILSCRRSLSSRQMNAIS